MRLIAGQSSQQPWIRTRPSATTRRASTSLSAIQIGRLVPSWAASASGMKAEFDMTLGALGACDVLNAQIAALEFLLLAVAAAIRSAAADVLVVHCRSARPVSRLRRTVVDVGR